MKHDPVASYVELRFFTPFDIQKIPFQILETIHGYATGGAVYPASFEQLSLPDLLLVICDETELKNGIRKELIKYYSK